MNQRRHITRFIVPLSLVAFVAMLPVAGVGQVLNGPQQADPKIVEPAQPPLSDNYVWDKNLVSAEPTASGPAAQPTGAGDIPPSKPPTEDAAALAKRVETLEKALKQMKAASVENLPAPAKKNAQDKKDAAAIEDCIPKKVDIISRPTFQATGRIYMDGVTYDDDPDTKAFFNTDRDNEFGFRTFRIGGRGNIYENLIYTVEVDLRGTNSAITYKDIYMEQQQLPLIGNLRAGHFKEPLGLEEFESDLFLNFMEKSPATQAFDPSRNFGVMAWNTDDCQDTTWMAGVFRADSPDSPTNSSEWRSDNNDWCYDFRTAWLPYYDEPSNGRYLVHLGGSYSFRHVGALTPTATYNQNVPYSTLNGLAEFSTRSWVGSQGPIGFGAEADSDQWNQLDSEFLVIWGAASFQSEYFQLLMNSGEQFSGGYAFFSYFLTGENRSYRKDLKVVDRTQPHEPFFLVDAANGVSWGWGAWELACGYSWVNLEDGHDTVATTPGTAANRRRGFNNDFIVGLNWYQNAWSRMYFDYERELVNFVDPGVPSSDANIFGVRWQVDW